ncbi:MAG: glutamine synthetase [Bacillota bacterium]
MKDLMYFLNPIGKTKQEILDVLAQHPEIKFVSLVGIDLAGNDTDEKIPMRIFREDYETFFTGKAVQTDGSSVVLTGIATLNDARVDMVADNEIKWHVDYNGENIDSETQLPTGTLRIPAFLIHNDKRVDSRSILKGTLEYITSELKTILANKTVSGLEHINTADIASIEFSIGTELEFWVKTPAEKADVAELSATQVVQENYWQRTRGKVRTALEQAISAMESYDLKPEMGHKEVGGVKSKINAGGDLSHVMEQLEIDWRFDAALQAADNELLARNIVRKVFRNNGLEVTFQAKPIIGVAGSGEHTHFSIAARMNNGKVYNLFSPNDMKANFLSSIGYGAIMGLLKNYEVVNPFVSATNDAFNRLKPGFEAPVCIVTSLGHTPDNPSRNRTILAGLVRDVDNQRATRFELRAPNPFSNTYIVVSALLLAAFDGIKYAVNSNKSMKQLEMELSKQPDQQVDYLETSRAYRSEHDVFEDYSAQERDDQFGKPPATVWENVNNLTLYPEKRKVLSDCCVFTNEIIDAFADASILRWKIELQNRIIPENLDIVLECKRLHKPELANDLDLRNWEEINQLRLFLAKDSLTEKSLFTRIREAIATEQYEQASQLQIEMSELIGKLKDSYISYKRNLINSNSDNDVKLMALPLANFPGMM